MASKSENYSPSGLSLQSAVFKNNFRLAENLIMRGANVNAMKRYSLWGRCNVNCSPLHIAVDLKNEAIIQLLLKHKADVNIRTSSGETALYIAAMATIHDNDEIIEMLIDAGAEVNRPSNGSLLSRTICNTKSAITRLLTRYNLNKSESVGGFCNLFMFITMSFFICSPACITSNSY